VLYPSLDDSLAEAFQPRADLGSDGVSFFYVARTFGCDFFTGGVERSDDVLAAVAGVQADLSLKSDWGSDVDAGFGGHVIYSVSSLLMHPLSAGKIGCKALIAKNYKLFLGCTICTFYIVLQSRCSSMMHRPASMAGVYPFRGTPADAAVQEQMGRGDAGSETFAP
jgi:hypothetical protein